MALDQHLPIVPITLNGYFDVLPIGSLNVHRHKMEMIIHPAISTEDMDPSIKGCSNLQTGRRRSLLLPYGRSISEISSMLSINQSWLHPD